MEKSDSRILSIAGLIIPGGHAIRLPRYRPPVIRIDGSPHDAGWQQSANVSAHRLAGGRLAVGSGLLLQSPWLAAACSYFS